MSLEDFIVTGYEGGAIDVTCLACDEIIASGGCECCVGNSVTVSEVETVSRNHTCERGRNG